MNRLRQLIRELIIDELEEISTTGNVAGYQTPAAFAGHSKKARAHRNKIAQTAGYTLAHGNDDEPDTDNNTLGEAATRYHGFKTDPTMTEAQKIGRAIQEINRQLAEMHRVVNMASRLKTETNTPQTKLWKRTSKHVARMESRLLEIQKCLRELRS